MKYFLVHMSDSRVWQVAQHTYAEDGNLVDEWSCHLCSTFDFVRDRGVTPGNSTEVKIHYTLDAVRNWWNEKVEAYGYKRYDDLDTALNVLSGN